MRSYKITYANQDFISQAGFEKVADLPFIFDSQLAYHRLGSRFIIDRGLGVWDPHYRGTDQSLRALSANTLRSLGKGLANFLEWTEIRGLDPITVDYKRDLIDRYQKEMHIGIWSRNNKPLSERTINARIGTASNYLNWLVDKSIRSPISTDPVRSSTLQQFPKNAQDYFPKQSKIQASNLPSNLREIQKRLILPDEQDISEWLNRLYAKKGTGHTLGLIAELILETGIRREEAACWRIDTLPIDPKKWRIVNPNSDIEHQAVTVTLRFGTKGREYGRDHSDKIGPSGEILVPYPMAIKLHYYRDKVRPKALAIATRDGKSLTEQQKIRSETVHLFLKPTSGQRYSGKNIYDFWQSVKCPSDWSPHSGRHFWACTTLWRKLQIHQKFIEDALKTKLSDEVIGSIRSNALSIIQLEIQPQLRHKSEQTTLIYLKWVADRLHTNLNLQESWVEKLCESNGSVEQ